jgi:hypothetical protein
MLTAVLVVAASLLATLAVVLLAVLARATLARPPAASVAPPQSPHPPASTPTPSPARDLDALARDLHEVVARYREAPTATPPTAPRPSRAAPVAGSHGDPAGTAELGELLAHTLETACTIPGADGAFVAVPLAPQPVIATMGLARHEGDRLAATLPRGGSRTRSIAISYEYENEARLDVPAGRIERGIAVPVPGIPVPALIAILTRAPAADLGEPQVALLEEVAQRLAPLLSAVLDVQTTATPVSISVRELDRGWAPPDARWSRSAER